MEHQGCRNRYWSGRRRCPETTKNPDFMDQERDRRLRLCSTRRLTSEAESSNIVDKARFWKPEIDWPPGAKTGQRGCFPQKRCQGRPFRISKPELTKVQSTLCRGIGIETHSQTSTQQQQQPDTHQRFFYTQIFWLFFTQCFFLLLNMNNK